MLEVRRRSCSETAAAAFASTIVAVIAQSALWKWTSDHNSRWATWALIAASPNLRSMKNASEDFHCDLKTFSYKASFQTQKLVILLTHILFRIVDRVDVFSNSEQGRCASQLLDAYHDKNVDDIKYIVKDSNVIPHLDHLVSYHKPSAEHACGRAHSKSEATKKSYYNRLCANLHGSFLEGRANCLTSDCRCCGRCRTYLNGQQD